MKTIAFVVLSLMSFVALATADWHATPKQTDDGFVNLRAGPGINFKIVGRVMPSDFLVIDTAQCRDDFGTLRCDPSRKWVYVQHVQSGPRKDAHGWINRRYVTEILYQY